MQQEPRKGGIPETEIGYIVILIRSFMLWDARTEKPRAGEW